MSSQWEERFLQYATDPHAEWPDGRKQHADKLVRRLSEIGGGSPEAAAHEVIASERWRLRRRSPTLFLANCGSSGSHWLTAMLNEVRRLVDCGEVYFPVGLLSDASQWDPRNRTALIDCVHLAHAPHLDRSTARSILVNSAHSSAWRLARTYHGRYWIILLIRDPLDIVVSRTFRKEKYRRLVSPSASDLEYLDENIRFVERFFNAASGAPYRICVRYEDMLRDSSAVLRTVCRASGIRASRRQLKRAAEKHMPYSRTTNTYRGPRVEPPRELVQEATRALEPVRRAWGYLD